MAQLKSSIVTGSLRVTDAVLTDTVQTSTVKAPTTSGGTTYGAGTSGQVLTTNGTSAYWGSLPEGVSPSSTTPKMDGTATVGTETAFARGDHIHPTDTTRAPLASPALTGTPTAPTATAGTNTTQIATTAFVKTAVDNKSVPSATTTTPKMDGTAAVGSETKWAKGDHVHPTDTSRAPLASPALTGTPTAPTAASGTNTTQIATTAFVKTAVDGISVPVATTTTPKMDGTAAVGSETKWAKGDHVHPTDTSRAASNHTHGNITNAGAITATGVAPASGDALVFADSSASNVLVKSNATFDGSTTIKALTPKGTFEPFLPSRNYNTGAGDTEIRPYVDAARANRLVFLPANQIIILKTTDGGTTWSDAGYTDAQKESIFNEVGGSVTIPLLNGAKSTNCGVRFIITGMKYNVPSGTAETAKYDYWNSSYINSTERYCSLDRMYFWISANNDTMRVVVEKATGGASTTWVNDFNTDFGMTGWSGADWIKLSGSVFGGGTTQTGNYWNWRITFWSRIPDGKDAFQSTSIQTISKIQGYGVNCWVMPYNLGNRDHLYGWDANKNASFPAAISATSFNGSAALTGTPTAPTAASGTNTTQIATTAFVKAAVDAKAVPSASSTTPKMDGTAAVGTETAFARGDHVHPTDTSRAASSHAHGNITNAGAITATGVALANNDTLVFVDSSDSSKLKQTSIKFDGSTATKALTQKGTFETFLTQVIETKESVPSTESSPLIKVGSGYYLWK